MVREVSETKRCTKCGEVKPRLEFTKVTRLPNAVQSMCKPCNAEVARKKYAEKPKEESALINRRSKLKRTFGLSLEQYDAMLKAQGGCCALCGSSNPGGRGAHKGSFIVDHCHATGKIRGLLCNMCNVGIGHLRDDVGLMRKAIDYILNKGV